MEAMPLERFSKPTRTWFEQAFAEPTPAQAGAWQAIASGDDTLVVAPTGSGKTLAAFLWSLDRLAVEPPPPPKERLRVLYVSPLKALAVDVERNLRSPLAGIRLAAAGLGLPVPDVKVALRTGDTPAEDRRRLSTSPPDVLITTPESLFLILTSNAREALRHVDTVIIDEVHAVAGSKRGAHLAVSLERLDELLVRPARRIGLSATVRPLDEVARFLGGVHPVTVVNPPSSKTLELTVSVPVEDMASPSGEGRRAEGGGKEREEVSPDGSQAAPEDAPADKSIWPAIEGRLVDLIREHRSTIVFVNSRRLAERISARVNDLAEGEITRAHHGSVSREQRKVIEEELKAGRLPAVVATSSLELGIDMGAVDLVIQIESPTSVTQGMQRIGRAGHQVGAASRGVIFPKYRGDLVASAVVAERMLSGSIEAIRAPRNPLDVLAQQIVAMVAMDDWEVDRLAAVIRRAAPFSGLGDRVFESVLDMLAGRYPSDEFAELRPRITWDRIAGTLSARPGAQRVAVTNAGTIPDRGLFGVFLAGSERPVRVGELDEEMVYESRVGDVFVLGSTSWRIEQITHDRVMVLPAPGELGRTPFWHGDAPGRPVEVGRAVGAFLREVGSNPGGSLERLRSAGLDDLATANLLGYLAEQREATGQLPDDRTIVIERFRDELGDWRLCIHSPFGARVHAPWALAIAARARDRFGIEAQTMHSDDGIVVRLPEAVDAPGSGIVLFEPEEIADVVTAELGGSSLFASRFRECAARALLLPRRRPGARMPLWQQRQRSAGLLQAASAYDSFPIVLETVRECLQDVFDLPGLKELMSFVRARTVRVAEVSTDHASPFASSLLFGYIAAFMYEGTAPLAERRAQALSLDTSLLAELLGQAELRELIDPGALDGLELDLQRLSEERRIRGIDDLHDALRSLGDLTEAEASARGADPAWLVELEGARRAIRLRIAGEERWAAIEDAARYRDAAGVALPIGIPDAFLEPVRDPLGDLVSRYARTHGPFPTREAAARLGLGPAPVGEVLQRLVDAARVVKGEFRPGGVELEWCDAGVMRTLRRRSVAALRKEAEPVAPEALARFLPAWHGIEHPGTGVDGLLRAVEQLQGAALPAGALERLVLPPRVAGYVPGMLDELCAAGEVVWSGAGAVGSDDGWVRLFLAGSGELLLLPPPADEDLSPPALRVRDVLADRGALFFRQIADLSGSASDQELLMAIWDLVWAGLVTNDTLAPLRALSGTRRPTPSAPGAPPDRPRGPATRGPWRPRHRRPPLPSRLGPPAGAGRWSLLPPADPDPTRRMHLLAEQLLDRHGVVTRGAVAAEAVTGGFAAVYPVLKAFEEAGRCRRGYFVRGLGGAQFAAPGAVDRLRAFGPAPGESLGREAAGRCLVLAAADPANPYGASLPWPDRVGPDGGEAGGHRPSRKAGATLVVVDGSPVVYLEPGGRTVLTWTEEPGPLAAAAEALAKAVIRRAVGKLAIERIDGEVPFSAPFGRALAEAGFRTTPRGLRFNA
jgi:ATP-dependent Lhr-like helicase